MGWRVALMAVAVVAGASSERPASGLRAGTVLTYESAGRQSEWRIDSVRRDSVPHCGRVWLTRGTAAEHRHHCVVSDLLAEQQRDGSWNSVRPIEPGLERITTRPNGVKVRYRTGVKTVDTISGVGYPVIVTEVTTIDSSGKAVQRLRERFSVALTTATWGAFERPDPVSGEWQVATEFRLVKVVHP